MLAESIAGVGSFARPHRWLGWGEGREQAGPAAEAVVDGHSRYARPTRDGAHADPRGGPLGHELPCGGEDRVAGLVDGGLAPAKPVAPAHGANLTYCPCN